MTEFYQIVSMSRPFGTLGVSIFCHRTLALPESPLDFLSVLLRFSLIEAVKISLILKLNYYTRAKNKKVEY